MLFEIHTYTLTESIYTEVIATWTYKGPFSIFPTENDWVLLLFWWAINCSYCRASKTVDSDEKQRAIVVLSLHLGSVTCSSFTVVFLGDMSSCFSCFDIKLICSCSFLLLLVQYITSHWLSFYVLCHPFPTIWMYLIPPYRKHAILDTLFYISFLKATPFTSFNGLLTFIYKLYVL